ncbi:DUF1489 family protein [Roseomonas sp. CCTCC AB2023176]|uniref:DUF1489 family protein n=1 Tax=Roseomonas sp. CCTCC AB2023176 TaxID=3342640 RepID=UPI0035E1497C
MLHLMKLSVGPKDVATLARLQAERARHGPLRHVTRMVPRRAEEICAGGSIYWVVAGILCVRQRILAIEDATKEDGTKGAALMLDPGLVHVECRPVKAFQGWRYLDAAAAPADIAAGAARAEGVEALPPKLRRELAVLGLL